MAKKAPKRPVPCERRSPKRAKPSSDRGDTMALAQRKTVPAALTDDAAWQTYAATNFIPEREVQTRADKVAFTERLIAGSADVPGVLLGHARNGRPNVLKTHQMDGVQQFLTNTRPLTIFHWDPGKGKTPGAFVCISALQQMLKQTPTVVITVPKAVFCNWKREALDWLDVTACPLIMARNNTEAREAVERLRKHPGGILVMTGGVLRGLFTAAFVRGQSPVDDWTMRDGHADRADNLFTFEFDLGIYDEAQLYKNPNAIHTRAHNAVSRQCTRRLLLTGTLVTNNPDDLRGIAVAAHAAPRYRQIGQFSPVSNGANDTMLDPDTIRRFLRSYCHRYAGSADELPPKEEIAITFPIDLDLEYLASYNAHLETARKITKQTAQLANGVRLSKEDVRLLQKSVWSLQQLSLLPDLYMHGAAHFKNNREEIDDASTRPSGAFVALRQVLASLRSQGHRRIVVCSRAVQLLLIAGRWLERLNQFGDIMHYNGELPDRVRNEVINDFLESDNAILCLNSQAGGTGLNIVGGKGCEAMVFFPPMPWNPSGTKQAVHRIWRYKQTAQITGKVLIIHMVPYGAVDGAIGRLHRDKSYLVKRVEDCEHHASSDDDDDSEEGDEDAEDDASDDAAVATRRRRGEAGSKVERWRTRARIIDKCLPVENIGGKCNFGPMPVYEKAANDEASSSGVERVAYQLLPEPVSSSLELNAYLM